MITQAKNKLKKAYLLPCWQVYAKTAGRRKKPVFIDPGKPSNFGKLASEKRKEKRKAAGKQPNFTKSIQGELMPSREKSTGYQRFFGDSIGDFSAKFQPEKSSIFSRKTAFCDFCEFLLSAKIQKMSPFCDS